MFSYVLEKWAEKMPVDKMAPIFKRADFYICVIAKAIKMINISVKVVLTCFNAPKGPLEPIWLEKNPSCDFVAAGVSLT